MSDDTLRANFLAEAIPNFRLPRKYLPPRPRPHTKSHISPVSAVLSKLKRPSLLACSAAASSPATILHAARPRLSRQVIHTRPILLLLPHPTYPDRRRDTFHPNYRPLHQISAALSHGARSIARISRSIWQRRSKSWPHVRMRSRWLPFVPTPRSWRSTLPFASYAGQACSVYPLRVLLLPFLHKF